MNLGTDINGKAIEINNQKVDRPAIKDHIKETILKSNILEGVNKRYLHKTIKARVDSDLQNYECNLKKRRERLKTLLIKEDALYTDELKEKTKVLFERKIRDEKEKIEYVNKQKLKEEEEFLAQKKLELEMTKCEEVRPIIASRREAETKIIQKLQMKQKEIIKSKQKDIESMWHKIMLEDVESRKQLEDEKLKKYQREELDRKAFLDSQIEHSNETKRKNILLEKELEVQKCLNSINKLNNNITEENNKKKTMKSSLGIELLKQIDFAKNQAMKSKMEENILENTMIDKSMDKYREEEKNKLHNKAISRKEIDLFNQHLMMVKKNKAKQEKQIQTSIRDDANKILSKIEEQRILFNKKRNSLLKVYIDCSNDIIKERDLQMEDKKKMLQLQLEESKMEISQCIENENKAKLIEKMEREQNINSKKIYNEYLKKQMEEINIAKEKQIEMQMLEYEKKMLEKKLRSERCMEILKREFESIDAHPFKHALIGSKQNNKEWHPFIPETKYFKY